MKRFIYALSCFIVIALCAASFAEGSFTIPMDSQTYEETVWPEDIRSEYDYDKSEAVFTVESDKDIDRVFRSFMDYQKAQTAKEAWLDKYRSDGDEADLYTQAQAQNGPEADVYDEEGLEALISENASGRQGEFEFVYAQEYELSFDALERLMYRAGAQSFSWQMSLKNRTCRVYDIVYTETEIISPSDINELPLLLDERIRGGNTEEFLLNVDEAVFGTLSENGGEHLSELLSLSGIKQAELQFSSDYRQVLVSNPEVYEAIYILNHTDSLNEEQQALYDLALAVADAATGKDSDTAKAEAIVEALCRAMSKDDSARLKDCDSEMYANMFYLSAGIAGLDVQFVSGTVDGEARLWNAVNYPGLNDARYYVDVFACDRKDIADPDAERGEPFMVAWAYVNFTQEMFTKYAVNELAPKTTEPGDDYSAPAALTAVSDRDELINWIVSNRKYSVKEAYQFIVNGTVTKDEIIKAAKEDQRTNWSMTEDGSKGSGCYVDITDDGRTFVDIYFNY